MFFNISGDTGGYHPCGFQPDRLHLGDNNSSGDDGPYDNFGSLSQMLNCNFSSLGAFNGSFGDEEQMYDFLPGPAAGDDHSKTLDTILRILNVYCTPVIISVGLLLNLLGICISQHERTRKTSVGVYVTACFVNDSIFLVSLLCLWLQRFGVNIYHVHLACETLTLLTNIANFLCTWLLVSLVVDGFIACFYPSIARQLCTCFKARLVVIGLVIVAVVVFVNTTLMFGLTAMGETLICSPLQFFFRSYQILTKMDIFINIVLPYGAIVVLVISLSIRLLLTSESDSEEVDDTDLGRRSRCYGPIKDREQIAATVMLSVSVLCLILPCHALRTSFAVRELLGLQYYIKFRDYLMQQIFQYPFHASFAIKPFLCLAFWKNYRLSLMERVKSLRVRLRLCCLFDNKIGSESTPEPLELCEIRSNNNEMTNSPSKSKNNGQAEWV